METTTKLIYTDGTVEENTDRRTIYGENYWLSTLLINWICFHYI